MSQYNFIAIEGNIGSGKTTLSQNLAQSMDGILVLEQFEENPFLPLFYEDQSKYALHLELSFLVDRFHQLKDLNKTNIFGQPTISDYYIIKCLLFANNNLSENEFDLFHTIFELIKSSTPTPDLIIYLDSSIERLQQNIQKRSRSFESNIKDTYLQQIAKQYDSFLKTTEIPTLRIDTDNIDLMEDSNYKSLLDRLENGPRISKKESL